MYSNSNPIIFETTWNLLILYAVFHLNRRVCLLYACNGILTLKKFLINQ